jgi:predicted RND superfamily exporter protein
MNFAQIISFLLGVLVGILVCMLVAIIIYRAGTTKRIPQADHHAQRAYSLLTVAEEYRVLADSLDAENARLSLAIADLQAQLDINTHHHDTFIPRVRNASANDLRLYLDSLNAVYRGHALHPR